MKKAFILLTVLALAAMISAPALAGYNFNFASVSNHVGVVANTGGNTAMTSTMGVGNNDGGNAGSASASYSSKAYGGDAGSGGGNSIIQTGEVNTTAMLSTSANNNYGKRMRNVNTAFVNNSGYVVADTGHNFASDMTMGVGNNDGGDTSNTSASHSSNAYGGDAGMGGGNSQIFTGNVDSTLVEFTVVNSNISRFCH